MLPPAEKRFLWVNKITIISLFVLILAGGVVRSTGSGMGCPDWPKCFDRLVPPTAASQLPEGYEEKYIAGRQKKNERFAKMLERFGNKELAERIRNDESILQHEPFNAAKTWTEYINRLVGAITGFLLLLCAIFSFTFFKTKKSIFIWSVINVIAVGYQAWLGSIVVSTNLMPWIITVHMLLALVIVGISIYTYFKARSLRDKDLLINHTSGGIKVLAAFSLFLIIVQVAVGTGVREEIDLISASSSMPDRSEWLEQVGQVLDVHRSLAVVSAIVIVLLFFVVRSRFAPSSYQSKFTNLLLLLMVLQFVTAALLAYVDIPPFAQTAHLVLASLLFGNQYYLMLLLGKVAWK
ncbi:COX15/CtaA family protein [Parapedobacter sp. ISTM3]|uniref:COX15/CtaA family protein n=1 Tax=Parapedobacter sp. ISTM3 TaxID=2800130 RepID=UPI0019040DE6|nr:COX15/CtaA family protein [Parapedobacter sp. ISTM3]MBK1440859.1 COX15/CtaA family protein [Parapedobacter sp. ISTM3]